MQIAQIDLSAQRCGVLFSFMSILPADIFSLFPLDRRKHPKVAKSRDSGAYCLDLLVVQSLAGWVTLGKLVSFSKPQSPHL